MLLLLELQIYSSVLLVKFRGASDLKAAEQLFNDTLMLGWSFLQQNMFLISLYKITIDLITMHEQPK